jgi:hypothetical protein
LYVIRHTLTFGRGPAAEPGNSRPRVACRHRARRSSNFCAILDRPPQESANHLDVVIVCRCSGRPVNSERDDQAPARFEFGCATFSPARDGREDDTMIDD